MRWLAIAIIFLIFLAGCAREELPPPPPLPGGEVDIGRAVGGLPIEGKLPNWAAPLKYTDVSPVSARPGETVDVIVEGPTDIRDDLIVYSVAYAFNSQFRFWEKVNANKKRSGSITQGWARGRAVFEIPVSLERFTAGANYFVIYWCLDTGERDEDGFKIWDCNNQRWGLGAFELVAERWPDILIEKPIENNRYQDSIKTSEPWGTNYVAKYEDLNEVRTDVSVLQVNNVKGFKEELADDLVELEPGWTTRGNVCGFLISTDGSISFSWISGSNWLTVTTFANVVDDAKIGVYGKKYPSNCDLLDELKEGVEIPPDELCGNVKIDPGEECDKTNDAECQGGCKPDCTCSDMGEQNTGVCGDNLLQRPNADGVVEQCEPAGMRDPVTGQLISLPCFIRNAAGGIAGIGGCTEDCKCEDVVFTEPVCGDGSIGPGEECGEPGTAGCDGDQDCIACRCWDKIQAPPEISACIDSDEGVDGNVTGNITLTIDDSVIVNRDVCINATHLREFYCINESDMISAVGNTSANRTIACDAGCMEGACVAEAPYGIYAIDGVRGITFTNREDLNYTTPLCSIDEGGVEVLLLYNELVPINLGDYFVLNENNTFFTHILKYDEIDTEQKRLLFSDLATGQREVAYSGTLGVDATAELIVAGVLYKIEVGPGNMIRVDLNGDGEFTDETTGIAVKDGPVLDVAALVEKHCGAVSPPLLNIELGCVASPAYKNDLCSPNGYRCVTSLNLSRCYTTLDACLPDRGDGTCVEAPAFEGDTCEGYRVAPGMGRACYTLTDCQEACPAELPPGPFCTDTDNGINYGIKGFLTTDWPGWDPNTPVPDRCAELVAPDNYAHSESCIGEDCYLLELWCEDTVPQRDIYQCDSCSDGVCIETNVNLAGAFSSETEASKSAQIVVILLAAFGVLGITLYNVMRRD